MAESIVHQFEVAVIGATSEPAYLYGLEPARGQSSGVDYPGSIGVRSNWVENQHPETKTPIAGWKWDHRLWSLDEDENWHENIPWCMDPSVSGITASYFQKGMGAGRDLELLDIEETLCSGMSEVSIYRPFTPVVNHGWFFLSSAKEYLHADDGVVTATSWDNDVTGVSGAFSQVELAYIPKDTVPITARQYYWNSSTATYHVYREWNKRFAFTGLRDADDARQITIDPGNGEIFWDNLDPDLYEFILTTSGMKNGDRTAPDLIFNQKAVTQPSGLVVGGVYPSDIEVLGISDGTADQEFHTYYSPVDSGMPHFCFSFLTAPDIFMDTTGIANLYNGYVGGGLIPSGVAVPASGITEWLVRREGTVPSGYMTTWDFEMGLVRFDDIVPPAGEYVAVAYYNNVRVDYEAIDTEDDVRGFEANINPLHRHVGEGFVTMSRGFHPPTRIVLTSALDQIDDTTYGPLDMGSAYAALEATVYGPQGETLEGEVVTFEISSSPAIGAFGSNVSVTAITNQDGKAFAYYNPPKTIDEVGEEITFSSCTEVVGSTLTLRTSSMSFVGGLDEVRVYQTNIDDYTVGAFDTSVTPDDYTAQRDAYYDTYLTSQGISGPTGTPVSDYISGKTWEELHREVRSFLEPLIHREAAANVGSRHLVATWSATALNPHDFVAGAWVPKKPDTITEISEGVWDVQFDTSVDAMPLPTASNTTPSGVLYSYYLVAPTTVLFEASAVNEATNQIITSNEVGIQLSIPDHMDGVWLLDEINQVHIDEISSTLISIAASNQEVPLGWRLPSTNLSLAAMLGGVIFVDKNPEYTANIWDPDVVPPLRHQFEVI
tara:strand:- start:1528 stop:4020 length:2493 start_codon:yes stop_codon:yes gene_type:complete